MFAYYSSNRSKQQHESGYVAGGIKGAMCQGLYRTCKYSEGIQRPEQANLVIRWSSSHLHIWPGCGLGLKERSSFPACFPCQPEQAADTGNSRQGCCCHTTSTAAPSPRRLLTLLIRQCPPFKTCAATPTLTSHFHVTLVFVLHHTFLPHTFQLRPLTPMMTHPLPGWRAVQPRSPVPYLS